MDKRIVILFFLCAFSSMTLSNGSDNFEYEGQQGQEHWDQKYAQCGGKHQSPINIDEHNVEKVSLLPLRFENFDVTPKSATVTNNGHTVQYKIETDKKPKITGGPLIGKYEFAQAHFHWGAYDWEGSENQINNVGFPLELHMVFHASFYGSFEDSIAHPDGLTVLAFLFSISDEDNHNYDNFIQAFDAIQNLSSTTSLTEPPNLNYFIMEDRNVYFTYGGSLTTPPCLEVVTWIEFRNTVPLSSRQIRSFRNINGEHGKLMKNFRSVQPINGRIIRMNVEGGTACKNILTHIYLMFSLILLLFTFK